MARVLSPSELFPAGRSDIGVRMLALSTGVRLRVAEGGPASGEPVVMLHGWGACLYTYRHAFASLTERGHRVIAVDMRGYGLSDHPSGRDAFTLDAYLADLAALLDVLALARPILVGHSMGGAVALHFALRHAERVRALALVNPAALVPIPILTPLSVVPRSVIERFGEILVPRWLVDVIMRRVAFADASRVTERDVDEYWAPTRIPGYVRAARGAVAEFSWRSLTIHEAERLAVPTVVMLGRQDRLIPGARGAAERLRGSTVHSIEGGHCVHEEQPDVVYPAIADFLAHVGNSTRTS